MLKTVFLKINKSYLISLFHNPSYFLPLFAIAAKEASKLYFLVRVKEVQELHLYRIEYVLGVWIGLQVLFSTIQGIVSDKFCRKKTLVFTLGSSIVSILLLDFSYVWIAVVVDGMLANTTPIGRAAYLDQFHNIRKHQLIADTFIAQAIPWVFICYNENFFYNYTFLLSVLLNSTFFILVIAFFKDRADRKKNIPVNLFLDIRKKFFNSWFIRLLIAFFLLELCYFFLPYFSEENLGELDMRNSFVLLGIGVAGGCFLTKYFHFPSRAGVMVVFMLYSFFFTLNWLAALVSNTSTVFSVNEYLLFSFMGGASLVLIYSCFSDISKSHEEGFIFGVLESLDSLAEFVTPIVIGAFAIKSLTYYPFIVLLVIAFLLIVKREHLNQDIKTRNYE